MDNVRPGEEKSTSATSECLQPLVSKTSLHESDAKTRIAPENWLYSIKTL